MARGTMSALPGYAPPFGGAPPPGGDAWREPAPWWLPEEARGLAVEWASYRQRVTPLLAATSTAVTINFGNNQCFTVLSTQQETRDASDQSRVADPNALIQLTDESGSINLFNGEVHLNTVFGTGREPFYWQVPRIIAPGITLTISVASLEPAAGGVDYDLYLTFSGFKIFGYKP